MAINLTNFETKILKAYIKECCPEIRSPWIVEYIRYGKLTDIFVIAIKDAKDVIHYVQL